MPLLLLVVMTLFQGVARHKEALRVTSQHYFVSYFTFTTDSFWIDLICNLLSAERNLPDDLEEALRIGFVAVKLEHEY